jgi:hypothetical protein
MTTRDIIYLSAAAAGIIALAFKFRHLRRQWGTPQLWAVIATIFFASVTFWCSSPQSIHMLNRATGITNFTAPLVYCLGIAFAGAMLLLAIFWRFPPAQAWPKALTVIVAYTVAITAIPILFSVSDVSVERITDFETYYATQPTVAALLMIYIMMCGIGAGLITYGCLKWARSDDLADRPWLRRGLRLYGIAALLGFISYVEKFLAVVSNWVGLHWLDTANTVVPMIVALPGMLSVLGAIVLPIWGPRLPLLRRWMRRWAAFWTLRPMHRSLRRVDPAVVLATRGKFLDPHHRVRRQLTELADLEWRLQRLFDPAVEETARRLGQDASLSDEDLQATVHAAQLEAALVRHLSRATLSSEQVRHDDSTDAPDSTDFDGELASWLRVAKAYVGSPIVAAAVAPLTQQRHALTASGPKS